jgi:hypothetical protein
MNHSLLISMNNPLLKSRHFDRSAQRGVEKSAFLPKPYPDPDKPLFLSFSPAPQKASSRPKAAHFAAAVERPPISLFRSQLNQCPAGYGVLGYPIHGAVSSRQERAIAPAAIQPPIHKPTLDTHDKINPRHKQSGTSRTEPFNAPL